MDRARQYRLTKELEHNNKQIEILLKQAEILENRNYDIQEELNENA